MCQVLFIDLVLAGDNAVVVGMVAANVQADQRRRVICSGIALAVVLRIMFAAVTMQLLDVIGLTLAGGLLLLWVCWKLYREIRQQAAEEIGVSALDDGERGSARPGKTVAQATVQVAVADLSMSLDNVLAVAGAADDHSRAMIFGLVLSVILMGVGATFIAHLLQRYQWIAYLGLALIGYVALSMIWRGSVEIVHVAGM